MNKVWLGDLSVEDKMNLSKIKDEAPEMQRDGRKEGERSHQWEEQEDKSILSSLQRKAAVAPAWVPAQPQEEHFYLSCN